MKDLTFAALAHGITWAIEPQEGRALWAALQSADADQHLAEYEGDALLSSVPETPQYELRTDGVAVLHISGVMTKKPASMGNGCSTIRLKHAIRAAASDKAVRGILLVVDSPGGAVNGTQELYDEIKAATAKKKVYAFVDDRCFSAAYWAASAATKLIVNRTGYVGSLGVLTALLDASKAFEAQGLEMIVFATGDLKGTGMTGAPITEAQRAHVQSLVENDGQFFVRAIASGRKMKVDAVRALFTGGLFPAAQAKQLGLVDEIATQEQAIAELSGIKAISAAPLQDMSADLEDYEAQTHLGGTVALAGDEEPTLTTISASGGSTGPVGAGKNTTGGTNPMNFREILTGALGRLGLGTMTAAVAASASEDPQALASIMADNLKAQAEDLANERVKAHPLLQACSAAGINDETDLKAALEMKGIGEKHLAALRTDAKGEAIRAFGQEAGEEIGKQVDALPVAQVETLKASWTKQADTVYGIGGSGDAPARKTVPSGKMAADVDDATPKSNWEKLTDDQKAHAEKMGIKTDAKREKYAENVLASKGGE